MEKCILCGSELVEGKCPNSDTHFKIMCLNCEHMLNGVCVNEDNMTAARDKILSTIQIPSGYEIEDLKLKPVPLKDATKKCSHWVVDTTRVMNELLNGKK